MKKILLILSLVLSGSVNASIINALNGVNYEWLELTATQGLSRDAVELRLSDVNDVLYGYQYASRQQVEDLYLSYTSWDGLNGFHGSAAVVDGVYNLITDLGITYTYDFDGAMETVDGYTADYTAAIAHRGLYGLTDEIVEGRTMYGYQIVYLDGSGAPTMAYQHEWDGWAPEFESPSNIANTASGSRYGSYLIRPAVVPVPSAVWLFGSGLIGLIGFARRNKFNKCAMENDK